MRRALRSSVGVGIAALMAVAASSGIAAAYTPSAAQSSSFAALRGAPVATVPSAVKRFVKRAEAPGQGTDVDVDVSATRRVPAPDGGFWDVTPGPDDICLYIETEQTGLCASTADAKAGALHVLFVPHTKAPNDTTPEPVNSPRVLVGLLPDNVKFASAAVAGQAAAEATPNAGGLYRLNASGSISHVLMHRAGGRAVGLGTGHAWNDLDKTAPTARAAVTGMSGIPIGNTLGYGIAMYGPQWGPFNNIVEVKIGTYDGNWVCGNAATSTTWAGSDFCVNQVGIYIFHAYNGTYRHGYAAPLVGSSNIAWAAEWW